MRFLFLLFLGIFIGTQPAQADWTLAPNGNWISQTPTAIGVSVDGVKALSLTCANGSPLIYTSGYPATPGQNRQDSFTVTVEGRDFPVTGEHSPPDGLWTGTPPAGLVEALKKGGWRISGRPVRARCACRSRARRGRSMRRWRDVCRWPIRPPPRQPAAGPVVSS
ncbi:MAG: hypothetical protein R8G60_15885 [Roseovarius pacificus]|nr:hypothetical protein [Roseovarius pacificus]